MKIKTLIVDDESSGREILSTLLNRNCPEAEITGMASSADEAERMIKESLPQLVFLDINMPKVGGFELLKRLDAIHFEIIFVTAHDDFAIKAFKYAAVDYLLKPVKIDELKNAFEEAKKRIELKTDHERINFLLDKVSPVQKTSNGKLILPTLHGYDLITISNIIRCESEANYTRFYFKDNKSQLVSKTLKEFENILAENNFFRVHRSHMINMDCITGYIKGKGGEVKMSDGSVIEVSREKKEELLKKLQII